MIANKISSKLAGLSAEAKCKIAFLTAIFLLYIDVAIYNILVSETTDNTVHMPFNITLILLTAVSGGFFVEGIVRYKKLPWTENSKKKLKMKPYAMCIVLASAIYLSTDLFVGGTFIKPSVSHFFLGYALCGSLAVLTLCVTNAHLVGCIIFWAALTIISVVQHYVVQFRGCIFTIKDLNSVKSAMNVKDDFSFEIDPQLIMLLMASVMVTVLFCITDSKFTSIRSRGLYLAVFAILTTGFVLAANYAWKEQKDTPTFGVGWSNTPESRMSTYTGTLLTLYYDTRFNTLIKPDGYSAEKAQSYIVEQPVEKCEDDVLIIAILEESWADLFRYEDISVTHDPLSYYRSLDKNVIKGYVGVSPFGGMTCNSEFEFLTGNSLYFFPEGSAVFTNYMDHKQEGLVSYLNQMGFETTAYCPFDDVVWSVGDAYEYLEFDNKIFASDIPAEKSDMHASLRISDRALFEKMTGYIEEHRAGGPEFYWLTTAQNHSPYNYKYTSDVKVDMHGADEYESYLNAVDDTDDALEWLITKYENDERKVYIVVFGDHFPSINGPSFKLKSDDVFESQRLCHQTPYFIWSNQEIGYAEKDLSLNYLSNDLLKAAGLPLSPVQTKLEEYRESIPQISEWGYQDKDGIWHKRGSTSDYDEILNEYNILEWYRIFDEVIN